MKTSLICLVLFTFGTHVLGAHFTKKVALWTLISDGTTAKSYAWLDGEMDIIPNFSMGYGIDINVTGFTHKYKVGEKIYGWVNLAIRDIQKTIITEFSLSSWKHGESRNIQAQIKYAIKVGGLTGSGLGFDFSLGQGEVAYTENYNGLTLTKPCPEP